MVSLRRGDPDPASFLPLTPLAFHVLLALAGSARHGYAIIQEVLARTDGLIRLRSGTLYTLLQRLADPGLITEVDARLDRDDDDARRRYYDLTRLGRAVLEADARRLEAAVNEARRKHVLKQPSKVQS